MEFQQYIRDLISANEVNKAFEEIDKALRHTNDKKLKSFFNLFQLRYKRAENDMMMGRLTSENMYVEHNRILQALMDNLHKIPKFDFQVPKKESTIPQSHRLKRGFNGINDFDYVDFEDVEE